MGILLERERELLTAYAQALGTDCPAALFDMLRCCVETQFLTVCSLRKFLKRKGLSAPSEINDERLILLFTQNRYLE